MQIAFVVGSFPALSETFILNQMTGLIDRGHAVHIYASGPREDPKRHPDVERYGLIGRTYYMPVTSAERLRAFGERFRARPAETVWDSLRSRLRRTPTMPSGERPLSSPPARRYDIVHCHFGESGLTALAHRKAGQLAGPLITTFYGADLTKYVASQGHAAYAELFERGDAFLAISDYFRARMIQIGCPAERIQKHPLGIDLGRFPFIPRQRTGNEAVRLLTIARLEEKKGVEYALRALKQATTAVPIEYTIVGDGSLRPQLEKLARELPRGIKARFAGWMDQEEVAAELSRAHVLLAPSVTAGDGDQEGTPVAIIEAMASGLPVITTRHTGIPELVEDGVSGRLVGERDVAALSRAIQEVVGAPDRWVAMGFAGRARAAEKHDINKLNRELLDIYQQLLGERARTA